MFISHCPLCRLIFEFRTEVGYHLRNDHRFRPGEEVDLLNELQAGQRDHPWPRLTALQSVVLNPSTSLLLDIFELATSKGTTTDIVRFYALTHAHGGVIVPRRPSTAEDALLRAEVAWPTPTRTVLPRLQVDPISVSR